MTEVCGQMWTIAKGTWKFAAGDARLRRLVLASAMLLTALVQSRSATAQMGGGPTAQDDSAMTGEEVPVQIHVLANDIAHSAPLNPASIQIVSQPLDGFVTVDNSTGTVWYVPDTEFWGYDSFTYTVADTLGNRSNVATVHLMVMPDTTPPVIQNFQAVFLRGTSWRLTGTVIDDNPGGIRVTFGDLVNASTTTDQNGNFSFTTSIPSGSHGDVTAQAVNAEGIQSVMNYVEI